MTQMIRTQIYLPPELYAALKQRCEEHGIAMAEQIRLALRAYLADEPERPGMLRDGDPLWDIVGIAEGPADASREHDHYVYGWPKDAE